MVAVTATMNLKRTIAKGDMNWLSTKLIWQHPHLTGGSELARIH